MSECIQSIYEVFTLKSVELRNSILLVKISSNKLLNKVFFLFKEEKYAFLYLKSNDVTTLVLLFQTSMAR